MKNFLYVVLALIITGFGASFLITENYSNGERIGYLGKFSKKGRFFKSWEGDLNVTQTGMNSSALFSFSVDNDDDNEEKLVAILDSAANFGWKIKVVYHEVYGYNWLRNRGETDFFVTDVVVLSKSPVNVPQAVSTPVITKDSSNTKTVYVPAPVAPVTGVVHDTIYLVIYRDCPQPQVTTAK